MRVRGRVHRSAGHRARTVSPPTTCWPTLTAIATPGGTKTSMRDPNFMSPKRSPATTWVPGATRQTIRRASMPTSCRATTSRSPRRIQSSFRSFSCGRLGLVGRQELARRVLDAFDDTRERDPVDVHVERRQEDADLLPLAWRRHARFGRARHHDPAVGRRDHQVVVDHGRAFRVSEEIRHEARKGDERHRQLGATGREGEEGGGQGARNERGAGSVDTHP